MNSRKLALTLTAIAAGWTLSACSHNNAPAPSAPVDSAVAAESQLNKSGCAFSNVLLPTTGSETQLQLVCKPTPGFDQTKTVSAYTQQIVLSIAEKGRKNTAELTAKLKAANTELFQLETEDNIVNSKSIDPSIKAHSPSSQKPTADPVPDGPPDA